MHEYQSKKLLQENGVNVQRFHLVTNEREALEAGKVLSKKLLNDIIKMLYILTWFLCFQVNTIAKELVIKAQILAGGRGKGVFSNGFKGGVHLTKE